MKSLAFLFLTLGFGYADLVKEEARTLPSLKWTSAEAGPVRRVSRRTARRTTRRTYARQSFFYNSLPGGCYWASPYYSCGGVYYQPVMQNGSTVYVIVDD